MGLADLPSVDPRPLRQKFEEVPAKIARHQRKVAKEKELEDAYEVVNQRDGNVCWVSGEYLQPGAVEAKSRREHHHLKGRRVRPEWVTKPERIILVSALVHDLITRGLIEVEGDDARKPLFFHWAAHVRPEHRIFRIQRRFSRERD